MVRIAGIVAEYNPYHNGHQYLTQQLRSRGATHIVSVMSGHLVQRGEPAVFSKWARTEAALKSGVDLVLELPSLYSCLSAERFADAAVGVLEESGCIEILGFGSESGDLAAIMKAAEIVDLPETQPLIRGILTRGISYAAARQAAVQEIAGADCARVLSTANDILAVEYCRALNRRDSRIQPCAVTRKGAVHDSKNSESNASSSFLRDAIFEGKDVSGYLPEKAAEVFRKELEAGRGPCRINSLETAILLKLRSMTQEGFLEAPDVSEGLENRLYRAARKAGSLEEFYQMAKTKRYAQARLRRIAIYSALGITKKDISLPLSYLRILGMNHKGAEVVSLIKANARLPYGTSLKRLVSDSVSERIAAIEMAAGDLFALGVPSRLPSGIDYTEEAIILNEG